jgi:predicted PhzF superfamily epimerase YddE/YHI9
VQECGAGLVRIRVDSGMLAFAEAPMLRYEPADETVVDEIVRSLRLGRGDVLDAMWIDNGPGWVAALLRDPAAVRALTPGQVTLDLGVVGVAGREVEVRAFFPRGGATAEDPVTGSLNAGVARWLVDTGRVALPYVAAQTSGRVHVSQDDGGTIWVGGGTITCVAGELLA